MATIPSDSIDSVASKIIKEIEDEEKGFFETWFKIVKKLTLERVIKGFMSGIGVFMGSLVCHYYILPHLDLQYYSLFLVRLHQIK